MEALTSGEFTRLANNFYSQKGLESDINRIAVDADFINYINANQDLKKFKIAFCSVVLNEPYWQYTKDMVQGAKQLFLPGHDVDFFIWSDMPTTPEGATVFPTESVQWPMPTLMRYHLYLQQEEVLKKYDYIFHCDVDMRFVNVVGDEILGEGLTVAPHPGYFVRKELWPPYEPNEKSGAYVKRPGFLIDDGGRPRFMPFYAAGGVQGGTSKSFIKAMKVMRKIIDSDLQKGYIPIWNDESVWNKYLFEVLPKKDLEKAKFLTPSYVYPDSLIEQYYEPKVWGQKFTPRIVTLTKPFTISKEGGDAVAKMIQ